jgi:hypothetical protein
VDDSRRRRCTRRLSSAALAALLLSLPSSASAQIYEVIGTRAQGMGGAFVAVADDASATWWNPAGLILSYFSIVTEHSEIEEPDGGPVDGPAWRAKTGGFAVGFPALGVSYYRLRVSQIAPEAPTAPPTPDRQDLGVAGPRLFTRVTNQFGATVGQSLGNHLVLASTFKVVRAGEAESVGESLDVADDLDVPLDSSADLDIGVLVLFGPARFGGSIKHLWEPTVGEVDGAPGFVLARQARVGASWMHGQSGAPIHLTVAADADVTRTPTIFGDARHVATGTEVALPQLHLTVRGGLSWNTVGNMSRSASTGVSIGLSHGFYFDAARTFGTDRSRKGWAAGFRLTL